MLPSHHGKIARVAGLLVAGGLMIGGLTLSPALAGDAKQTTETLEVRKIVHVGPGKPSDHDAISKNCSGQTVEVTADGVTSGDRKEAAKIKLCLEGATRAETATRLEQVLADLDKRGAMDAGVKAQLKAKLTAKIAELRAN